MRVVCLDDFMTKTVIVNKYMIINFHPKEITSKKGLEIIERLNIGNEHVIVPVSDKNVDEWRALIDGNQKLILVAPVYWWGAGYEFDKWVQDIFSHGYAFVYDENGVPKGLLNGRKFELHMTHGTPKEYSKIMQENIKQRMDVGIFGFCGAKVDMKFYDLND